MRFRRAVEVDLDRFDLWASQLIVDATDGDAGAISGDFFMLDLIRDRIVHAIKAADVVRLNTQLEDLLGAVGDEDFAGAGRSAEALRSLVASVDLAG